jgi:hypothetical protein
MKEKTISIKCEIDKTEIKETINLIRRLKYEVIELQKQGLASKVINKILLKKYSKKTQKLFVEKK